MENLLISWADADCIKLFKRIYREIRTKNLKWTCTENRYVSSAEELERVLDWVEQSFHLTAIKKLPKETEEEIFDYLIRYPSAKQVTVSFAKEDGTSEEKTVFNIANIPVYLLGEIAQETVSQLLRNKNKQEREEVRKSISREMNFVETSILADAKKDGITDSLKELAKNLDAAGKPMPASTTHTIGGMSPYVYSPYVPLHVTTSTPKVTVNDPFANPSTTGGTPPYTVTHTWANPCTWTPDSLECDSLECDSLECDSLPCAYDGLTYEPQMTITTSIASNPVPTPTFVSNPFGSSDVKGTFNIENAELETLKKVLGELGIDYSQIK